MRNGFAAAILLIALPAFAEAPVRLTLPAAIEQARTGSPELRKLELSVDVASAQKLEALSGHLPQIHAGATEFLNAKYARLGLLFNGAAIDFPSAYPQLNLDLEGSITLFDGLKTIRLYQAANLGLEAAELELSHGKLKVEVDVRTRFDDALAARAMAEVADQNIRTLEQHLSLASAGERAGIGTRVDVLRIESQLEEARADKILAEDNVVLRRRALTEALGLEEDARELEGELPVPSADRIKPGLQLDLSRRDDVQAQIRREQALDRVDSAAAAFWYPKISFFGLEQFYKYGNFDPLVLANSSLQNAWSFGFRMSWALFDGGASISRKSQAEAAAKQAIETTRQATIASPNEFELWKRRYLYNAALYRARQRSVEKSVESVRLATLAVKAGVKTNSEALDAELDLFRAREGVIRAQVDAAEALARLELALGHDL